MSMHVTYIAFYMDKDNILLKFIYYKNRHEVTEHRARNVRFRSVEHRSDEIGHRKMSACQTKSRGTRLFG